MENKTFFTVKQVADYFNTSRQAVYLWINSGEIGFHKFKGRYRISKADIRAFETRNHSPMKQTRAF